ncbi:MAG: hypothetical protein SNJ79_06885, partial [Sphingomonadaceae bacterium]
MIRALPFLLLAAAASAGTQTEDERAALYEGCVNAVASDPGLSERFARAWAAERNGGIPARQCLGLALVAQNRPAEAARAFADAARLGEQLKNPLVPDL